MDYRCVAPLRSFFSCNDFLNSLPFLPWFGENVAVCWWAFIS
jgi:hypothetical protein